MVKTDQEPAIEFLIKDVIEERGDEWTVVEFASKHSSASNGICERAVQSVGGQIRAITIALEENLCEKLMPSEPNYRSIHSRICCVHFEPTRGRKGGKKQL